MTRTAASATRARGGRRVFAWIAVALLVVPTLEIALIVRVGSWLGAWPTFALLLAESAFGAWIVRRQGRHTWGALREALAARRVPGAELADAALVLVGGVLLLTPGFLTDAAGFFLVLPPTRRLVRPALGRALSRKLLASTPSAGAFFPSAAAGSAPRDTRVVPGEVVSDDR
ncbi:MAG: FxsA family protein [Kineosporiaceae bacterium]